MTNDVRFPPSFMAIQAYDFVLFKHHRFSFTYNFHMNVGRYSVQQQLKIKKSIKSVRFSFCCDDSVLAKCAVDIICIRMSMILMQNNKNNKITNQLIELLMNRFWFRHISHVVSSDFLLQLTVESHSSLTRADKDTNSSLFFKFIPIEGKMNSQLVFFFVSFDIVYIFPI